MHRFVRSVAVTGLILGCHTAAILAQVDAKEVLDGAREAQRRFEEQRRSYLLPPPHSGGGRCDERFGSFCYWYDGDTTPLPEEADSIGIARQALLADLAERARELPHDEWIAGQRIRYLVEAGDTAGAIEVAEACRVASWWCDGLRGFAYHAAGRPADAEAAFSRAFLRMTPAGKCLWEDLSPLLDEATAARYLDLDCNARRNVNRRYLWLADPFLGDSVNDLTNELHARQMTAHFLENAATAYGQPFTFPQRDMIFRYGWAVRWTRNGSGVQGHEARPSFPLGPESWWDSEAERADGPVWSLDDPDRPRLRYAPTWLDHLVDLAPGQTALFRRGDSTLVAAVFRMPQDSLLGRGRFIVLAMSRSMEAPPTVVTGQVTDSVGRVLGTAPWYPGLLDVAVRDTTTLAMARARYVVEPPPGDTTGPALSEMLFVAPETFPTSLEAAVGVAVPSLEFVEGSAGGIYWEMYRFPQGKVDLSLTVIRNDRATLSRIGAPAAVPKGETPIRITWENKPDARRAVEPQSLGLDLSRLRRGRYLVVLDARLPDGKVVRSTRPIDIVKRT